ncbi:MAG: BACON domain-containing protein, partial [Gammaproteobacteria bacterium]|nr:BACON domain-containing protein [Gammaproteobacteria bacterium]
LDLQGADPFYDIAGDPDLVESTPFDQVYFPVLNQEHIDINAQNKEWFLTEIAWGNCILSISANSNSFTSTGGSGSFSVTAPAGCDWTPVESDSWITLTSGADSGNGTVSYSVAENTGSESRSGFITVGGQTYNIPQQGADILPEDFCNVNVVSDLAENASISHEACEVLVIGPSFTTEDGSSVDLNSGL